MREIRTYVEYVHWSRHLILDIHVYDRDDSIAMINPKRTKLASYILKDALIESRRASLALPMSEDTEKFIRHELKTLLADFYQNEITLLKEGHDSLVETMLQKYLMMEELTQ